jgi:hypothetical protein
MQILETLGKFVKNFDANKLNNATDIRISKKAEIRISLVFTYFGDQLQPDNYQIELIFHNCRFDGENFEMSKVLNINRIVFIDVKKDGWEGVNWLIRDEDEDGTPQFKFYCQEIRVGYVKIGEKTLYEERY